MEEDDEFEMKCIESKYSSLIIGNLLLISCTEPAQYENKGESCLEENDDFEMKCIASKFSSLILLQTKKGTWKDTNGAGSFVSDPTEQRPSIFHIFQYSNSIIIYTH